MPTYEYVCAKCGHEFEKVQSMTAAALTECPKDLCPRKPWGKGKVKRQVSAGAGLIFKGSGFYITDYRSEGYKAAAKKEGESSKSSDSSKSSSSTKSDAAKSSGSSSSSASSGSSGSSSASTSSSKTSKD
jgi:putative FmdB family regulatory protein